MIRFFRTFSLSLLTASMLFTYPSIGMADDSGPNGLQSMMFFRSFVQDDSACQVGIVDGKPMITGPNATKAAAACPDAFAWVQLADAIRAEWWNWGVDQTIWPQKPLPLCTATVTSECCDPNAAIDPLAAPNASCPVFRADYAQPSPLPAAPNGTPSGSQVNHRGLVIDDEIDPGRVLRDLEVELVFRSKPMVDYIYRNDLYTLEGLGARNRAQNDALSQGKFAAAHALEVEFPAGSVMVKADFIHQDVMLDQKLISDMGPDGTKMDPPNNAAYPYLTVWLEGDGSKDDVPGYYYMVAMTNSSKSLPNWHWYALEHVANPGRCDFIGCNDSFGYQANGTAQAGADFGPSYIPPKMQLNNDKTVKNDPLFLTAQFYDPAETGEKITQPLAEMLAQLGIGSAKVDSDPRVISPDDPAWMNYRLKGTQTNFVTSGGVPTGMGATVTEGGFVNSASCMTCHAQAAVNNFGASTMQGVGASWMPDVQGYSETVMGPPMMNWFYQNGGPSVFATQIDFVWGILNANCVNPVDKETYCASYPDAPTIIAK